MTPEEKAIRLFNKMHEDGDTSKLVAKYFAIIAIDEVLNEFHMHDYSDYMEHRFQYFKKVKEEIKKL